MIRLFAVNILPLQNEACFKSCYLRASEDRRKKADALKMQDDKARCIAAGLLLEYAYKKFRSEYIKELAQANSFGYAPECGESAQLAKQFLAGQLPKQFLAGQLPEKFPGVRTAENGKPYFAGLQESGCAPVYFNLSHSDDYVICAMADFEVGADIQDRTDVRESVVRRFFSEREKKRMEQCGKDEVLRERVFARIWAEKEAQAKLTGRGIGQLLGTVPRGVGDEECDMEETERYRIWQGEIAGAYAWAVASYREQTDGAAGKPWATGDVSQKVLEAVIVDGGELFYE